MDYHLLIPPNRIPAQDLSADPPTFTLPIPRAMQVFMNYSLGVAIDQSYQTTPHPLITRTGYPEIMRGAVTDQFT